MKRNIINFIIDVILIILISILGITGLLIFPGLLKLFGLNLNAFPKAQIYNIHHWIGLLLFVVAGIHVDLHWKWIVLMTKRFLKRRKNGNHKSVRKPINLVVDIVLLIAFLLVVLTGIIKFPGFLPFLGINPLMIPLNELSFIHDWSGTLLFGLVIIHLALHFSWMVSTTKTLIHSMKTNKINVEKSVIVVGIIIASIMTLSVFAEYTPLAQLSEDIFGTSEESVTIEGIGRFTYNPKNITTVRDDIFKKGSFSIFDILIHLNDLEKINMKYHFEEEMNTHVIDSINGITGWWYRAYYDGGWSEINVFRMDHYPYKEEMRINVIRLGQSRIDTIYSVYKSEIQRNLQNDGKIIIPTVKIRGTKETLTFNNVEITPHNLRTDVFQDDVITAIDVIMTLGDQNKISYDLQWYDSIGTAKVVRSHWVDKINNDRSVGRCGFVYEEGAYKYSGFQGNHIHIPSDMRVINSPEYEEWFWICI